MIARNKRVDRGSLFFRDPDLSASVSRLLRQDIKQWISLRLSSPYPSQATRSNSCTVALGTRDFPMSAKASERDSYVPEEVVVAYHERTKHHFNRYAAALGYMD